MRNHARAAHTDHVFIPRAVTPQRKPFRVRLEFLFAGQITADGRVAGQAEPILHPRVHLMVDLPLAVLLIHLVATVLPIIAHRKIRPMQQLHLRHRQRARLWNNLAEFPRHKPPHSQPMQQFRHGVPRAEIGTRIISRQHQSIAPAVDDEPFLTQLWCLPGWNFQRGHFLREPAWPDQNKPSCRRLLLRRNRQLRPGHLAHIVAQFHRRVGGILRGVGRRDNRRCRPTLIHEHEALLPRRASDANAEENR